MAEQQIQWWKPGLVLEEARCTWADWLDALIGKRETFIRVEHAGSWCICEKREMAAMVEADEDGGEFVITEVRMTRRQFERLPEFGGW